MLHSRKSKKGVEQLRQYREEKLKEYAIMVQYKQLKELAPSGVYLLPSNENLHVLYGVIFLRQGLYKNGVFKFRVNLPKGYPGDGQEPWVTFFSRVFHPCVESESMQLDLTPRFPEWSKEDTLAELLKYIKTIFYLKDFHVPKAINERAAMMYVRNRKAFLAEVKRTITLSLERRYVNEPHSSLLFSEFKPHHQKLRVRMLGGEANEEKENASTQGVPKLR